MADDIVAAPQSPPTILNLLRAYEEVTRVVEAFDAGGRIISMVVATRPDVETGIISGSMDTSNLEYPPQMINAIITELNRRRNEIADKLVELGVNGLGSEQRR